MTTGFRDSSGVDADAKFAAYVSGTKPAIAGFRNASGTDVRDLLQPLPGTSGSLHGMRNSGGQDFNALFSTTSEVLTDPPPWAGGTASNNVSGGSASIVLFFQTNGTTTLDRTPGVDTNSNWGTNVSGSNYEILFENLGQTGGGSVSGTFGSWLSLGSQRSCGFSRSGNGEGVVTIRITIRRVGGSPAVQKTINLEAIVGSV